MAQAPGASGRLPPPDRARALYPLVVDLVAGDLPGFGAGVYRYDPPSHSLPLATEGDVRARLAVSAAGQRWVAAASAILVVAAEYGRTAGKDGERGIRDTQIEVGAVAQNVHLQAEPLGFGTTLVGAFDDAEVAQVLELPAEHRPLGVLPVGSPALR